MSGLLAGKIWQSNLESHLKPLAAAMADIANDDGTSIFPSVAYLAWLLGKGERSVQYGLDELKGLGVIQTVAFEKGGRGKPTEYRLIEQNLPARIPWKEIRKGATSAPIPKKGAINDSKRVQLTTERVQFEAERVQPIAPDPLVEPLVDTSIEPNTPLPPFCGPQFLEALADFESQREEMKKPLSKAGRKRLYAKLAKCDEDVATGMLNDATISGWRGVFNPKGNQGNGNYESASERNIRNLRETGEYIRQLSGKASNESSESAAPLLAFPVECS